MRRDKLNKIASLLAVVVVASIILYIGLRVYIHQEWPFIPYFDMRAQYRQFLSEFERIIKNSIDFRTLPFWSWNFFLGSNFWASKSIQLLGDVFAYVSLMFETHPYNQMLYIIIVKYVFSAITFYLYLNYRKLSFHSRLIGALGYAFSSYMIRFTEQVFFMSFFALLPLYLIGIESILRKQRPYFFIIITSLLIVTNYYLFYTVVIFSVIYFVFRMVEMNVERKESIRLFASFILMFLISLSITMVIILPSFYSIIENPRVGVINYDFFVYPELTNYFNIFMSFFIPMQSSLGNVYTSNYYNLESYIWAGSIFALLLPQVFIKGRNSKQSYIKLFLILFVLLLFPIGGSVLHGFSEPSLRWQFLIVIFMIIATLPVLEDLRNINKKVLIRTLLIYIGLIFSMYFIYRSIYSNEVGIDLNQIYIYLIYSLSYVLLTVFLIMPERVKKLRVFLIVLIVVSELSFTMYIAFNKPSTRSFDWETIRKVESVLGENRDLQEYLLSLDSEEEFYRVYVPYDSVYWVFSLNMNLIYDFMDSKTYDSTYLTSNNDLFRLVENQNFYKWFIEIKDPEILDFIGTKYAIVRSREELPHQNYEFVGIYNYLEVYRNLNYRGVFKAYNLVTTYDEYQISMDTRLINSNIIVEKEDFEEIRNLLSENSESYEIKNAQKYPNMLLAYAENQNKMFVVSNIPYDEGWEVSINGEIIKTYSTNGGFISFSLPQGGGQIKMYFVPKGFKVGLIVSFLSLSVLLLYMIFNETRLRRLSK